MSKGSPEPSPLDPFLAPCFPLFSLRQNGPCGPQNAPPFSPGPEKGNRAQLPTPYSPPSPSLRPTPPLRFSQARGITHGP